ncbi:hypothetical protein C8R44DRAFT_986891 [Mycena epipterygia]|nr:hypothetical protein C8R44DRAFT_986891 [Mycena epipterygia]
MASLPTEIIHQIILGLPTPFQQAKMCGVCRRFNEITVPVLYHSIHLGSLRRTAQCCQTLLSASVARSYCVRNFVVSPLPEECSEETPPGFFPLLDITLRTLSELEHLHLWFPTYADGIFDALATLILPCLRRFGCHQPGAQQDHYLTGFLSRHPALKHLEIIRPWKFVDSQSVWGAIGKSTDQADWSAIYLPSLRVYRGSLPYFSRICVPARGLTHATFWDIPQSVDFDALGNALAAATAPNIPFSLRVLWDGPITEVLVPLAKRLPNLQIAEVEPFMATDLVLFPSSVEVIAEALAELRYLVAFNFDNVMCEEDGAEAPNYDPAVNRAMLVRWSQGCPSLVMSQLHNRRWERTEDGDWEMFE